MAFIIDTYNKYDAFDRENARKIFEINGNWYAIKEVELEWGQPKLPLRIDGREQKHYFIYNTFEEAFKFAEFMKSLN